MEHRDPNQHQVAARIPRELVAELDSMAGVFGSKARVHAAAIALLAALPRSTQWRVYELTAERYYAASDPDAQSEPAASVEARLRELVAEELASENVRGTVARRRGGRAAERAG